MPAAQRAGKTALILAAESGSLDAVKALLASKCDAAAVTPVICAPTCSRSWRSSESVGNQRLQSHVTPKVTPVICVPTPAH